MRFKFDKNKVVKSSKNNNPTCNLMDCVKIYVVKK